VTTNGKLKSYIGFSKKPILDPYDDCEPAISKVERRLQPLVPL